MLTEACRDEFDARLCLRNNLSKNTHSWSHHEMLLLCVLCRWKHIWIACIHLVSASAASTMVVGTPRKVAHSRLRNGQMGTSKLAKWHTFVKKAPHYSETGFQFFPRYPLRLFVSIGQAATKRHISTQNMLGKYFSFIEMECPTMFTATSKYKRFRLIKQGRQVHSL